MNTDDKTKQAVLANFDFEKVHAYMVMTGWRWCGSVPSLPEVIQSARERLADVGPGKITLSESGGLQARYKEDEEAPTYQLRFIIETSEEYA